MKFHTMHIILTLHLRFHSRYEMSQDLLDKQVEILERRYGGLRARRAAVTIQRAFRRRQLLKKFSAITAMAKAADSTTRRLQDGDHGQLVNGESDHNHLGELFPVAPNAVASEPCVVRLDQDPRFDESNVTMKRLRCDLTMATLR